MPVSLPTPDQLKRIAEEMNLSLTDSDIASFLALMKPSIDGYNVVDQLPGQSAAREVPAHAGLSPASPRTTRTTPGTTSPRIEGAPQGKLKGKRLVIKDNVMVAGVPMMNGASTLEGYIPEIDATVVTRILDAGGTILGKAHCEYYCLSGGSHTNATGPVHNPYKKGYSAGGSSSGSAVLVALGEADMAHRRRPGRLDPHARLVLRHLRHEADPRPRALHRHHADRDLRRPHRSDDRHRQGQRAAARGHRRARRLRPPPVRAEGASVHRAAGAAASTG